MNKIKRFGELQVVVRFHEVRGNGSFVHSIRRLHRRDVALRKADMCVFCKLKGPRMYFLFGIYWPQHFGELSYCNLGDYSCTFCIYSKWNFN